MSRGSAGRTYCHGCLADVAPAAEACPACGRPRGTPIGDGWLSDPLAGRLINDKYQLEARIGCGGFGLVHRARQVQQGVDLGAVVLKSLHPRLADDPSIRRRFINEARAARAVTSPHVVKVFELDEVSVDGTPVPFIAMEHLEGEPLSARLAGGPLPAPAALGIARQVAQALEACHAAGVVHRDLKPANVLLLDDAGEDFVKVIDFGIARVPAFHRTQTAILFGTPKYMPPEQLRGDEIDGRVDIYALGVILYEALAGVAPIEAPTPGDYLRLNIEQPPVPLRQRSPQLPEALEALLERLLAKRPEDRPTSMADVALRLQAIGIAAGWLAAGDQPPGGVARAATAVHTELALQSVDRGDGASSMPPTMVSRRLPTVVSEQRPALLPEQPLPEQRGVAPARRGWLRLLLAGLVVVAAGGGIYVASRGDDRVGAASPASGRARDASSLDQRRAAARARDAGVAEALDHADAGRADALADGPALRRRASPKRGGWRKVPGGL